MKLVGRTDLSMNVQVTVSSFVLRSDNITLLLVVSREKQTCLYMIALS